MSFKTYTFVYEYLMNFLEGFNEKWSAYHFHLEPFLEGSEDIVGIFSDNELFVFFYIEKELPGRYREEESQYPDIVRLTINPDNMITNKELEFLLLNKLLKLNSFREKMKYVY